MAESTKFDEDGITKTIEEGRAILKVSAKTPVASLAGAITKTLDEVPIVELQAIGAGAVNQAVKGAAKSRGFIAMRGRDLILRPGFDDVMIDGEEKTRIILVCSMQ